MITDPPYSEYVHASVRSGKVHLNDADYGATNRTAGANTRRQVDLGFEHITPDQMGAAARQFARLVRRWVVVFSDIESAPLWRDALTGVGLDYVRTGIWVKPGSAPQFSGDRPGVGYEAVVIAHPKGKKRWNGGGRHAVWTHPIALNRNGQTPRFHPTEKPVGLMARLVGDFTEPGEKILDAYAGSGSTGVAAIKSGRYFIGSEIDGTHYSTTIRRLEEAYAQPRLLGAAKEIA